jgi:hypothetical protein
MTNDNPPEHPRDLRTLELTTREVKLLLKYGYPFEDEQKALRASRAVKGYHRVRIGAYWIEMMVADLIRSAKELRTPSLLDEIDALCDVLENALANPSKPTLVVLE